jgi:hypothetical protein
MKKSALPLVVALMTTGPAISATFYTISSVTSSTSGSDLFPAANLIQGPGVGYDAAEPHTQLGAGATHRWVTAAPGGFPSDYVAVAGAPVITLDLGENRSLSEISIWGYTATNANGVSEFRLRFATAAEGTGGFGTSITYNPTFGGPPPGGIPNDDVNRLSFPFAQSVTARFVEFTASDNWFIAPGTGAGGEIPGGDRMGLGEIAFAVPEPSTVFLGLAGLPAFLRRRRLV